MQLTSKASELAERSEVKDLLDDDHTPWYRKPNLRSLYLCLLPAALGVEIATGYDGSVLNGLQAVASWNKYFNNPNGALLGIMSAAFPIGSLLVLPIVPWANDHPRLGRKPSIIIGAVLIVIGVILQTASVNMAMFLVARLLLGMGIPFGVGGASQLLAELAHPKDRAVVIGLFSESFYIGSVVAAGVTLGTFSMSSTWSWRIPSLLQVLPIAITLIFIWWVPESPRFLTANNRSEEALAILVKFHAEGDSSNAFVQAEFAEIQNAIALERQSTKQRWVDLLKTGGNRHRAFIAACVGLFLQWSGNGLFAYYLPKVLTTVGITVLHEQNVINLGLQCWNLVTGVSGAFVARYMGRRRQYLVAFTGMTIVFAVWTAMSGVYVQTGNTQAAAAVVAMIFIYAPVYNTMMPLTYVYVTEVFPYGLRAKGVAITQTFSRAGSAFNQFINPLGIQNLGWKLYLVYVGWLVCELSIIYLVYPETKGPTLEEVALIFDGLQSSSTDAAASVADDDQSTARKNAREPVDTDRHIDPPLKLPQPPHVQPPQRDAAAGIDAGSRAFASSGPSPASSVI